MTANASRGYGTVGRQIVRPLQINRVDLRVVGELLEVDDAGRFDAYLLDVLLAHDDVAALLELVALHDVRVGHFLLARRAPALLLDARLAFGVKLVEAQGRAGVGGRKHLDRDVHKADLEVALPGGACGHAPIITEGAGDRPSLAAIMAVRMNSRTSRHPVLWLCQVVVCTAVVVSAACSPAAAPPRDESNPGPTPTIQRTSLGEMPDIDADALLAHTRELSSDRYEGRRPGHDGESLTVGYLVDQFRRIGLKPGNTDGTFIQKVPLVGITASGGPLVLTKGIEERQLAWKDDVVAWSTHVAPTASLEASDLVFVGYGVVAPEYNWDDYKGLDVKGKTLVMLIGDPPVPDPGESGRARREDVRRPCDDLLRPLDLQVRGRRREGGRRRAHRPRDRCGRRIRSASSRDRISARSSTCRRRTRTWAGSRSKAGSPTRRPATSSRGARQDFDLLKATAATREFVPVPLGVTAIDDDQRTRCGRSSRATSWRGSRDATPSTRTSTSSTPRTGITSASGQTRRRSDLQRRARQRGRRVGHR